MPNGVLADLARANLRKLNDFQYDAQERKFALRVQETLSDRPPLESVGTVDETAGTDGKGSTDVSDVSWVVPTGGFTTACWVPGTPGHSWQATAAGGMSIGRKGMELAARTLAAMAWDLYHNPGLITAAREEHRRRLAGRTYQSLLLPGQEPPLDYRDPPRRGPAPQGKSIP